MNSKNKDYLINTSCKSFLVLILLFFLIGTNLGIASIPGKRNGDVVIQQSVKIKGTLVDEMRIPIMGVSVIIQGTTKGTVSVINGNFELNEPVGSVHKKS